MALPTPTPSGTVAITNPGFETGTVTGWTLGSDTAIATDSAFAGTYSIKFTGGGGFRTTTIQSATSPAYPGMQLSASVQYNQGAASFGHNPGNLWVTWYDIAGNRITDQAGNEVNDASGGEWKPSSGTFVAPAGAAAVTIGVSVFRSNVNATWADSFNWDYNFRYTAVLTQPGIQFTTADTIPCRITITPDGTATVNTVQYYLMTEVAGEFVTPTLLATLTDAPYSFNAPALATGTYAVYAVVTLSNGLQITTNSNTFAVGAAPPPDTREYKASNAYTYLVGEGIIGLGSGLPSTAIVTGVEVEIDYALDLLVRSKDKNITDPEQFTSAVAFAAVTGGVFETTLMSKSGGQYTVIGSPNTTNIPIAQPDFSIIEDGVADSTYRWTVYRTDSNQTVAIGGETAAFNVTGMSAADFLDYALAIRFFPTLGTKPDYADAGDMCVRLKVNRWKIKVYFDAGSVEYYFASPDKTQVIKGTLVAYNVADGDFRNSDASGTLQLAPELEIMDGTQSYIGDDWTIHSQYPPTDNNQIGEVADNTVPGDVGMRYNGLATQKQVYDNRSRYVFITSNFYGDTALESMYAANGYGRGFAYNGNNFYKIYTQPDAEMDKPRHVAFHHSHLALGYLDGRVDISAIGEPYNFSGLDGASSWAIGDPVTGLLPLSGAILGVFCKKSIVGISGTTVDNFATQNLSPSLGAVEYTITDMGFPVYANTYGVYTLSQTQQYGDYLGLPLSQQVSPWLRPRLIRKATSDKEVVVAWPVRSKNQYKLAFSDGYVLSMTMNYGQQSSPTFSKQKYFLPTEGVDYTGVSFYEYPAIYPIAISSELDESGEERIHVADLDRTPVIPVPPVEEPIVYIDNGTTTLGNIVPPPPWLQEGQDFTFLVDGDEYTATWQGEFDRWLCTPSISGSGWTDVEGTLTQGANSTPATFNWSLS